MMAWTPEQRRRYAPAIEHAVRSNAIVRLARVCGAWAHGKIHVMYQWLTNRRSCAHIYTCMPTWNYFPAAVSGCNKAQCMPTDRKLGTFDSLIFPRHFFWRVVPE